MGDLLKILQDSGGFLGTVVAAVFGLWWFISKGLPVINSNMAGIAKENTSRTDMIEVLRQERDAALVREAAAEERYSNLLKDWAEMRGQFKVIEADLDRANKLITELNSKLVTATDTINALRADVNKLTQTMKGGSNV